MIAIASTAITLALVFYTIGVFAERRAGNHRLREEEPRNAFTLPPPEHWRVVGVARALRMRDVHGNSGAQARLECRLCKRDRHFCCRWATDLWSQGQAPA